MEYVCDLTDDYPGIEFGDDEYSGTMERKERIVRCRDCSSYRPGYGVNFKPRCEKSIATFVPKPDGFCAWGEEHDGE